MDNTDFKTVSNGSFLVLIKSLLGFFAYVSGVAEILVMHFFSVLLMLLGVYFICVLLVDSGFSSINKGRFY